MAICSASGWEARFRHEHDDGTAHYTYEPLLYWKEQENGDVWGYCLDGKGRPTFAESYENFIGYEQTLDKPRIYIPAAPGWKVTPSDEPIIGWVYAQSDYTLSALALDNFSELGCTLYEPDEESGFVFEQG